MTVHCPICNKKNTDKNYNLVSYCNDKDHAFTPPINSESNNISDTCWYLDDFKRKLSIGRCLKGSYITLFNGPEFWLKDNVTPANCQYYLDRFLKLKVFL